MKLEIIRIENHVVTCELDGGGLIDIAKRWFSKDIKVGDVIDLDTTSEKKIIEK